LSAHLLPPLLLHLPTFLSTMLAWPIPGGALDPPPSLLRCTHPLSEETGNVAGARGQRSLFLAIGRGVEVEEHVDTAVQSVAEGRGTSLSLASFPDSPPSRGRLPPRGSPPHRLHTDASMSSHPWRWSRGSLQRATEDSVASMGSGGVPPLQLSEGGKVRRSGAGFSPPTVGAGA
jgi:hypothetical protein